MISRNFKEELDSKVKIGYSVKQKNLSVCKVMLGLG